MGVVEVDTLARKNDWISSRYWCSFLRHLRLFHMAVPALVAGAVEAGLVAKEALSRRRRGGAPPGFTDDGFPLGLTFLLKAWTAQPLGVLLD